MFKNLTFRPTLVLETLLFMVFFGAVSHGNASEATAFQTWLARCTPANESQEPGCTAWTRLTTDSGKEMIRVMAVFPEKASEGVLQIRVPLGANLKAGIVLKVGSEGRENILSYGICGPKGCIADAPLSMNNLLKLRTSDVLEVRFIYGQPISIPLPLAGLDDALKHMGR